MTDRQSQKKLPPVNERFEKLGLVHDWDFVLHLPLRYEDRTRMTPVAEICEGRRFQVRVRVLGSITQYGRYDQLIAQTEDDTGALRVRFLHFYPNQKRIFEKGADLVLYGEVRRGYDGELEMLHPVVKKASEVKLPLPKTLTPVYPTGESLMQPTLRKRIDRALLDVDIKDLLPEAVRQKWNLMPLGAAVEGIHHPASGADIAALEAHSSPEWRRLKFDELLAQQICLRRSREENATVHARPVAPGASTLVGRLLGSLPFHLTGAQERVIREIGQDMAGNRPMLRLVQGDVGSGKTIVAAVCALRAVEQGLQVAFMAPTEILAEQHFKKLVSWLEPLGVRLAFLSGSLKPAEKAAVQKAIAAGEIDLAVGTHALIQSAVRFKNLALAIVDEQHRFGVSQRLKLREASGTTLWPHLLMLSATPIPRTLAMSYLSDIDVSSIDELPPGRTPVTTRLVNTGRLEELVAAIDDSVQHGAQCYWVCPLIEESEKADLTAASMRADYLTQVHPQWRVGLVHGALDAVNKQQVMQRFYAGEIDVLVATTVIEVGVDVPNASLMVIEHAERFGLSQLHQLRGRVGRGSAQSFCFLLYDPELSDTGKQRLKIIRENTDGFLIAREDLRLRGPGEFLGARQSGVPLLRFADVEEDAALLDAARETAEHWLAEDPEAARQHERRWIGNPTNYLGA